MICQICGATKAQGEIGSAGVCTRDTLEKAFELRMEVKMCRRCLSVFQENMDAYVKSAATNTLDVDRMVMT